MKWLWKLVGRIVFWASWPVLAVYTPHTQRTRVLIVSEGKVLVVRGWISAGKWGLPGGGLHRGEDPPTGACREVREETGLRVTPEQLQQLTHSVQNQYGFKLHYTSFFVRIQSPKTTVKIRRPELIEGAFVDPQSLSQKNAEQHVLDTLAVWQQKRGLLQ